MVFSVWNVYVCGILCRCMYDVWNVYVYVVWGESTCVCGVCVKCTWMSKHVETGGRHQQEALQDHSSSYGFETVSH